MKQLLGLLAILFFATSASAQFNSGGGGEKAGAGGAALALYFSVNHPAPAQPVDVEDEEESEPTATNFKLTINPNEPTLVDEDRYHIVGKFTYTLDGQDEGCSVDITLPYKTGVLMSVCDDDAYYPTMMVMGDEKATILQAKVMKNVPGFDDFVQDLKPIIIGAGRKPVTSETKNSFLEK